MSGAPGTGTGGRSATVVIGSGVSRTSNAERAAYAMLGWTLCGDNIVLSFGLAFNPVTRAEYAANGSFGLTNDYLRLANEHLGISLGSVGFLMGAVALAVPVGTLLVFARR